MGIFSTEMAAKKVHFQLPPPPEIQLAVFSQGDKKTSLIAGNHSLAHKYHHSIYWSICHINSTIFFLNILSF